MRRAPEPYIGTSLCDYGCGNPARYKFTTRDRLCCSSKYQQCPIGVCVKPKIKKQPGGYTPSLPYTGEEKCGYGCNQPATFIERSGRTVCSSHYRKCPAYAAKRAEICLQKTGYKTLMDDPKFQRRLQESSIAKYGVPTPFERKDIRDKAKITCLKNHGVENPFYSDKIQGQVKQSIFDHYGVVNCSQAYEVQQKRTASFIEAFGVDNPMKDPKVQAKAQATNIKRYGFAHPLQNREIARKSFVTAMTPREFILPSGVALKLVGYEPCILDELLCSGVKETDFDFGLDTMPPIFYPNPITGSQSRYYPDFFIPRLNWIIEVKSTYTFTLEKEINLAKYKRCRELGYAFNFIIRKVRRPKLLVLQESRPRF